MNLTHIKKLMKHIADMTAAEFADKIINDSFTKGQLKEINETVVDPNDPDIRYLKSKKRRKNLQKYDHK